MEAIRLNKIVEEDGQIIITDLPCKKGQHVEMILIIEPMIKSHRRGLTAQKLRHSSLIGIWKDRKDIKNSADYARRLREQAQNRRR